MSKIKILPPHVQNMIAAGEVVERPANVVKELIENSLDAGADMVHVEIQGGGQISIIVQDNGMGMEKEDLELAVKNHATSKIDDPSNLFCISSYGFRGEALPSIGSVSHLKISSRTKKDEYAHVIEVFYGDIRGVTIGALNPGTRVEVRDLFLKVPARLKFLKSTGVEAKRCEEVFYKIVLTHLDKEFIFVRDSRPRFVFHKDEQIKDRLSKIWPSSLVDSLLHVDFNLGDYKVYGYVGDPKKSQARGDRIIFYVNKRPIKDKLLLKALRQTYSGKILGREYPYGILFLDIPPNEVDVNVHPAKMEVRFRDESRIFSLIHRGVSQALNISYSVPDLDTPQSSSMRLNEPLWRFEIRRSLTRDSNQFQDMYKSSVYKDNIVPGPRDLSLGQVAKDNETKGDFSDRVYLTQEYKKQLNIGKEFEYLGQILDTYLLIRQKNGGLIIIDQHAAHERVLYENYKKKREFITQPLLVPIKIEILPDIGQNIVLNLRQMGFKANLGNGYIEVMGIPSILDVKEAKSVLEDLLNRDMDNSDEILKLISCKKAIKAGTSLDVQEAMELIELWTKTQNREFCPHGRPVAVKLGEKELEKMFKR